MGILFSIDSLPLPPCVAKSASVISLTLVRSRRESKVNIKTEEQIPGHWIAVDDDTYDGPGGPGERGSPIGSGVTEKEAIDDLLEQIHERRGETYD